MAGGVERRGAGGGVCLPSGGAWPSALRPDTPGRGATGAARPARAARPGPHDRHERRDRRGRSGGREGKTAIFVPFARLPRPRSSGGPAPALGGALDAILRSSGGPDERDRRLLGCGPGRLTVRSGTRLTTGSRPASRGSAARTGKLSGPPAKASTPLALPHKGGRESDTVIGLVDRIPALWGQSRPLCPSRSVAGELGLRLLTARLLRSVQCQPGLELLAVLFVALCQKKLQGLLLLQGLSCHSTAASKSPASA